MLEDVNNVLNTGDVPNLYAPEDDETITTVLTQCSSTSILRVDGV